MMENPKFCMPIDDVFHIRERGLVVTGRIESGEISVGDTVCFESADGRLIKDNVTLDGLEIFGQITTAYAGMNIGLFFKVPYINSLKQGLLVLPIEKGDIVKK